VLGSGSVLVTAAGPSLTFWDIPGGGRALQTLGLASKAITSVFPGPQGTLVVGALDGFVKAVDAQSFRTWRSWGFPNAVNALALGGDASICVGCEGQLVVRRRATAAGAVAVKRKAPVPGTGRHFKRGKKVEAAEGQQVVEAARVGKERRVDYFLRQFEYKKALDYVVSGSEAREVGVSLLDELIQRGGLSAATAGRDMESVAAILRWCQRAFHTDARSVPLVAELVQSLVAENPAVQHPQSKELELALKRVLDCVQQELNIQRNLAITNGMVSTCLG